MPLLLSVGPEFARHRHKRLTEMAQLRHGLDPDVLSPALSS